MVEHRATCRQIDHHSLRGICFLLQVEQNLLFTALVFHSCQMRTWNQVYRTVLRIDIVKCQPTGNQVGGKASPISVS